MAEFQLNRNVLYHTQTVSISNQNRLAPSPSLGPTVFQINGRGQLEAFKHIFQDKLQFYYSAILLQRIQKIDQQKQDSDDTVDVH